MSCSKPLPSFVCDSLYYLNRDQLERFSIVCRPLKNFIERYLHSKPYRVFDALSITGGLYALRHNYVRWHPNRDDYSVQQFLAALKCNNEGNLERVSYSFAEMRPYLGPTVRIKKTYIYVAGHSTYNAKQIEEMESIAYLWRDGNINIENKQSYGGRIVAEDFQLVLNSPAILQCQNLCMDNAHFSFKDYKVLYAVKVIKTCCRNPCYSYFHEEDIDPWQQFLEQPGVKPIIVFRYLRRENIDRLLDRLSKAFSSAVSPNPFTIVLVKYGQALSEFQETNKTSREKLELKKGLPSEYQDEYLKKYDSYKLERSSI